MALPAPSTQPSTTTPTCSEWSQTTKEPQRRSTATQSFEKAKTPQKKAKAKPAPAPNFQEGGASSSSSGNAPQPQAQTEAANRKGSRKTIKQNVKEAQEETANMTLLKPSKIGIQKLRETFEEANNRNTIAKTTYKQYRSLYNNWVKSAGDKEIKKGYLKELQDLYRQNIYGK